ncbi:hypothetical protein [Nocardia sp. X0981]
MDILTTFEILGATTGTGLAYMGVHSLGYGVPYWRIKDRDARRSYRDAAKIRRTWRRLARHTGLYLKDDVVTTAQAMFSNNTRRPEPKIRTPRLLDVKIDARGATIDFRPVPSVGLEEFKRQLPHLVNFWGMERAKVDQIDPRVIRVRAVRTDPLLERLELNVPIRMPSHLAFCPIGISEFGETVTAQIESSTGIGIYGAPRWGKTSLILGMMSAMSKYEEIAFVLADGKTSTGWEGDYFDMGHRCLAVIGDSVEDYNRLIKAVEAERIGRQTRIRQELKVPNLWDVGPSPSWPILVVVIDEAHSYFEQISPATSKELKERNALAAENAYITANTVKKCGSVGIFFIIGTQKPTAEAIPTSIRANLTQRLCLGVQEESVAVAALGEGIKDYRESMPTQFMNQRYKGCATTTSEHEPGFTRFRTPFCSPRIAAHASQMTQHLVAGQLNRFALPVGQDHLQLAPATPAALLEKAQDEN